MPTHLNKRHSLLLAALTMAGVVVFVSLLHKIYPYKAANFTIDRARAIQVAKEYLQGMGFNLENYHVTTIPWFEAEAFAYLQQQVGLEQTIRMMRDDYPEVLGYRWRIRWFQNLPRNAPQERFFVDVSATGKPVSFQHQMPDYSEWPRPESAHLSQEEARKLALQFLAQQQIDLSGYREDNFSSQRYEQRTDHTFTLKKEFDAAPGSLYHSLKIQGDRVAEYSRYYDLPAEAGLQFKHRQGNLILLIIISLAIFFLISLFLLIVFVKKYHEGEVGVYTASAVFVVIWTSMFLEALIQFRFRANGVQIGELSFDMVAAVILIFMAVIASPFFALSGMAGWSVGESLAHEKFGEKLASLNALVNRRFFTLNFARSALRGYSFGMIALGGLVLLSYPGVRLLKGTVSLGGYDEVLASPLGFLVPLLSAISISLLMELIYRLFGNLYLYKLFGKKWLAALITSALWAIDAALFWDINLNFSPVYLNGLIAFAAGLFFSFIFWKYDFLSVLVANFVVVGVLKTVPLLTSPAENLFYGGLASLALLAAPLFFGVRGFIKREEFEYQPDTTPGHIKRISERERMAKELEIARQVQMRLLPKESPHIPGCDIAGICIPAKEVGGDYYDFVQMSERKFGIVIGDVSGKGVPAAIYMTLTKGIFQSHAEEQTSPREVLVKVNSLMYRTIERGSFVSMFYAMLDMKDLTLRYCRAGHNPAIYFQRSNGNSTLLEPAGIALGLEEGEVFNRVIQEQELRLHRGDLLVFYTDGFTEAMNKNREEYGEERLLKGIQAHEEKPAREIIEAVCAEVKSFVKDYPQHDDMTMVVVKVQ